MVLVISVLPSGLYALTTEETWDMSPCGRTGEVPEWAESLGLCMVGRCRGGVPCPCPCSGNQRRIYSNSTGRGSQEVPTWAPQDRCHCPSALLPHLHKSVASLELCFGMRQKHRAQGIRLAAACWRVSWVADVWAAKAPLTFSSLTFCGVICQQVKPQDIR